MCAQTQVDRFESCGVLALKVPSVHARKAFDKRDGPLKEPGKQGLCHEKGLWALLGLRHCGFCAK